MIFIIINIKNTFIYIINIIILIIINIIHIIINKFVENIINIEKAKIDLICRVKLRINITIIVIVIIISNCFLNYYCHQRKTIFLKKN